MEGRRPKVGGLRNRHTIFIVDTRLNIPDDSTHHRSASAPAYTLVYLCADSWRRTIANQSCLKAVPGRVRILLLPYLSPNYSTIAHSKPRQPPILTLLYSPSPNSSHLPLA